MVLFAVCAHKVHPGESRLVWRSTSRLEFLVHQGSHRFQGLGQGKKDIFCAAKLQVRLGASVLVSISVSKFWFKDTNKVRLP